MRAVDRSFEVTVSVDQAWVFLSNVESWPQWAKHIKKVETNTPGEISLKTKGKFRLTNGITTEFAMSEIHDQTNWKWQSHFLWLDIEFDHIFEKVNESSSRLQWTIDLSGPGASIIGLIFGKIYNRNLDTAIPNLQQAIQ